MLHPNKKSDSNDWDQ